LLEPNQHRSDSIGRLQSSRSNALRILTAEREPGRADA
jgi:hypothetical protein